MRADRSPDLQFDLAVAQVGEAATRRGQPLRLRIQLPAGHVVRREVVVGLYPIIDAVAAEVVRDARLRAVADVRACVEVEVELAALGRVVAAADAVGIVSLNAA